MKLSEVKTENFPDSFYVLPSKILMFLGISMASISYVDMKEVAQGFCVFGGAVCVLLSMILYALRIWEKRLNIKQIEEELKNKC
jgi:hypothetical protein